MQKDEKYNYAYQTGQEIQILDHAIYEDSTLVLGGAIEVQNVLEDIKERKHFVGALYDLSALTILNASKPAEE